MVWLLPFSLDNRDVVQPGRTLHLGCRGRWFESSHPYHASLAQLVEHLLAKQKVESSNLLTRSIDVDGSSTGRAFDCESKG